MNNLPTQIHSYTPVNDLWPRFIEKIGIDKAQRAIKQALDLQSMSGNVGTLAVLLYETCGLALISSESLRKHIGMPAYQARMVLLVSVREESIQLLRHC